jgi:hypothetical protein
MKLLVLVALAACSRGAPSAPDGHPAMSPNERERGVTLCAKYVERVCACAASEPSLKGTCELATAMPEALRMHLDVLEGAPLAQLSPTGELVLDAGAARRPPLNEGERRLTEAGMREVIAACVKLDAELDPARCPRR